MQTAVHNMQMNINKTKQKHPSRIMFTDVSLKFPILNHIFSVFSEMLNEIKDEYMEKFVFLSCLIEKEPQYNLIPII